MPVGHSRDKVKIKITEQDDDRDCRVDFGRIQKDLGFRTKYTPKSEGPRLANSLKETADTTGSLRKTADEVQTLASSVRGHSSSSGWLLGYQSSKQREVQSVSVIPQFVPYWGEEEIKAVTDVLTGSDYLNEHRTVRDFETEFAKRVGAKYCVAVTSGTVALYCAIQESIRRGESVTIPSHDGIFAFNALLAAGDRTPIISDVNSHGLLDTDSECNITVHANGRIAPTVGRIEDCSQATFHHTKNHVSTYSFASTKHITTAGQGGAICCDSKETFEELVRIKDHGRNDRQFLMPMSDNYSK